MGGGLYAFKMFQVFDSHYVTTLICKDVDENMESFT